MSAETCAFPIGAKGWPCIREVGHDGDHFRPSPPESRHKHRWSAAGVCRCGRSKDVS